MKISENRLRKIVREELIRDRQLISESGLSRIHKHMQQHDCVIITAFRGDPNDSMYCTANSIIGGDNMSRNRDLKATLLGMGYGVTKVQGSYIENFGTDVAKEVKENSLFCVNLKDDPQFIDNLAELGERFCQDSILVFPLGGENAYLLGTNNAEFPGYGNKEFVGNWTAGRESEFMTRVGGRPFATESVMLETYNQLPRMQRMAVKAIKKRVFGR